MTVQRWVCNDRRATRASFPCASPISPGVPARKRDTDTPGLHCPKLEVTRGYSAQRWEFSKVKRPILVPPMMWMCMWGTVEAESGPVFMTER